MTSVTLLQDIPVIAGVALLAVAALSDVASRTVPNGVSLCIAAVGFAARLIDMRVMSGLGLGILVFAAATFCWRRGWMGGGDVKLLGAVALLVPPASVGSMLLAVALAGGLLAIGYLTLRVVVPAPGRPGAKPRSLVGRVLRAERWRIHRNCPLPYASAIAAGAAFTLLHG